MADALRQVLERSRTLGFLGPGPVEEHIAHAEAFAEAVDWAGVATAVDLGSGGGVPGLVLAVLRPDVDWVLLDGMQRRTSFLATALDELGLAGRVAVQTVRAEVAGRDPALRGSSDLVVARSFGPPPVTAECAAPLLSVTGQLVASEPPVEESSERPRWPDSPLLQLGLHVEQRVAGPPAFVRLRRHGGVDDRYPRRVGVPTKRPLWS